MTGVFPCNQRVSPITDYRLPISRFAPHDGQIDILRAVVVMDGDGGGAGCANGGVGGVAHGQGEGFVVFGVAIVQQGDGEGLGERAGVNGDGFVDGGVVGASNGRSVHTANIHRNRQT